MPTLRHTNPSSSPSEPVDEGDVRDVPATPKSHRSVESRLSKTLATSWVPIPQALVLDLSKLGSTAEMAGQGTITSLKPVHFYIICFLIAMKGDDRDPFPSAKYIANSAGLSYTTVLEALSDLQNVKLVRRYKLSVSTKIKTRFAYDLSPLFEQLDALTLSRAKQKNGSVPSSPVQGE